MPLFRPVILRIFVSGLILKKMADDYLGRKMEEYLARTASGACNRRPLATLGRLLLKTGAIAVTTRGSSCAGISSGALSA